jgi:putative transcriptional regulator
MQSIVYNGCITAFSLQGPMRPLRIGNKLRKVRIAAGYTQEELADLVDVTRQTIGLIEAGRYNPSLKLCLLLSRFTRTPLGELFWEEDRGDAKVDSDR